MKRSDFYIKLTTAVLFIAVVSYIGIYFYKAVLNTYETTTAIGYTVEQICPAWGYVVRSETVLPDSGLAALPVVGEGEKVAAGQAIAVEYVSREALETAIEIRSLRALITQLESSGDADAAEAARLESVLALSAAVRRGDLSSLDELSLNIGTTIFTGAPVSATDLPALQARLDMLEARMADAGTIYAPVSGIFSQTVDGFEHIGPDALSDLTPEKLEELFRTPSHVSGTVKLVTEFKWYYAALMDASDASRLSADRKITVQFSGANVASAEMTVERIGRRYNGECVVVFSSSRGVHELAPLRQLRADIVFGDIFGIRVPKEAIRLDDDGTTYIFLQTGAIAERVDVEILIESGDSYLVRDGAETGTPLRVGSKIIVKANDLFNGKVVG